MVMNKIGIVGLCLAFIGLLLMILLVGVRHAEARTITVDDSGGANYTNIRDAISVASTGDTIYVYNGTYYNKWNEDLAIHKTINLIGESNQNTIIKGTGAYGWSCIVVIASFVNISNLKIDNFFEGFDIWSSNNSITFNTITNCSWGIYLSDPNNNIISNTITNCSHDGLYLSSSSNNNIRSNTITNSAQCGISLYASSNNNVTSNTIAECINGIRLDSASNNNIASNTIAYSSLCGICSGTNSYNNIFYNDIYNNTLYGLDCASGTGNNAYNNWWGDASGPYNAASNPTGKGDRISDGVSFSPWARSPFSRIPYVPRTPKTITVDDSGGKDYISIEAAIKAARNGDTIYIYNGTYNEQVTINKKISLVGENNKSTIIKGDQNNRNSGISISTSQVDISNIRIDGFYYGIYLCSGTHTYGGSNNTTISNTVVNNSEYGIYLSSNLENNVITSNTITNVSEYGIYFSGSSNNTIAYNTITNVRGHAPVVGVCAISSVPPYGYWYGYAIYLTSSSNNTIVSNTIMNSDGIYSHGGACNILTSNIISESNNGIYVEDSYDNITTNIITNIDDYGICAHGSYNNLTKNVITNCNRDIYLEYGSNNNITSNMLRNFGQYGVYLLQSSGNKIAYNEITNGKIGIYLCSSVGNNISFNNISSDYIGIHLISSKSTETISNNISSPWGIVIDRYPDVEAVAEPAKLIVLLGLVGIALAMIITLLKMH